MGAVRTAGRFAAPAAWGKRVDTCGFYPLNSRFPLFLNLAQTRDRRPLRKWGTTEDFFFRRGAQCAPITQPIRNARYPTATHIGYSPQARHKVNCPKGERNHRVHFPFSIFNFPFYTHKKRGKHTLSSCSLQLIVPSRGDDCIQRSACGTVWAGFAAHKVLIMREIRAGEQADDLFAT